MTHDGLAAHDNGDDNGDDYIDVDRTCDGSAWNYDVRDNGGDKDDYDTSGHEDQQMP